MKYRILTNRTSDKAKRNRTIKKWFVYSICLLLFYALMCSGAFRTWQPFIIIPFSVAVALHERELPACVFALFCGYLTDVACRFIFGFSAVWLMFVCVGASLLSRNLIRVNLINFLWINLIGVFLEFSMDYLFNNFIWDIPNGEIILKEVTLPSAVATVIISPFIYAFVKYVDDKFSSFGKPLPYFSEQSKPDEDMIKKI